MLLLSSCHFYFNKISDNSKIAPLNKEVKIGQNITFTCESMQHIFWTFNGINILPPNARIGENDLRIENIQDFNQGKYVCHSNTEETYWTEQPITFAAASVLRIHGRWYNTAFK